MDFLLNASLTEAREQKQKILKFFGLWFWITIWTNERKKKLASTNHFPVLSSSCSLEQKQKHVWTQLHWEKQWRAPIPSKRVIRNTADSYGSTGVRSEQAKVPIRSDFNPLPFVIRYKSRISADCCYLSHFSLDGAHQVLQANTRDQPREADVPSAAGDPPQRWRWAGGGAAKVTVCTGDAVFLQRFISTLVFCTMWTRWLQSEHLGSCFIFPFFQ